MVISGMNRYFAKHGRIIGLVIVVIISVTFVLYLGGNSIFDSFSGRNTSTKTSILGRTVTVKDRQDEAARIYILYSLQTDKIDLKNINISLGSREITSNLLQKYVAEDLGIRTGDKAVAKYIKSVPKFQTKGKFDIKKYNKYVDNILKPALFSKYDLDEAVRELLTIQTLRKEVSNNIITTDGEIQAAYNNLNQSVNGTLIKFESKNYISKVKVNDEKLKNYYESNKAKYVKPAGVKALIAILNKTSFANEAAKTIDEKEVRKYYSDNRFLYIKKDTKATKGNKKPTYTPFNDVKNKIKAQLVAKKALEIAEEKAQNFADTTGEATSNFFYDINDKTIAKKKCEEVFLKNSKAQNFKIIESGWVYENDLKVKDISGITLVQILNQLYEDNPVSDPVKIKDGYCVAILIGKKEQQPEKFDAVKNQVKKDFIAEEALTICKENARNTVLTINERIKKGEKFDTIIKSLKLNSEPLNNVTILKPIKQGGAVQATALDTKEGTLSPVKPATYGAFTIFINKRVLPTKKEFDTQKMFFTYQYKMMKQGFTYRNFINSLSTPAK